MVQRLVGGLCTVCECGGNASRAVASKEKNRAFQERAAALEAKGGVLSESLQKHASGKIMICRHRSRERICESRAQTIRIAAAEVRVELSDVAWSKKKAPTNVDA
jgi:hypothetical protein